MKPSLRAAFLLFLTKFASAAAPAAPETPSTGDPEVLVRLLLIDEKLSILIRGDAQESFDAGRITESQLACLQTTKAADFTEGLGALARKELTAEQITRTIAFLRSKDGRRYGEAVALGKWHPQSEFELSDSELDAIAAFHASPAGKKLLETGHLMGADGINDVIDEFAKRVKEKCHLTLPLLPPGG